MPKQKDYTGMKFNFLTFVEFVRHEKVRYRVQYAVWRIKCDCGNLFEHNSKPIVSGQKKYCSSSIHISEKQKIRWDSRGRSRGGVFNHPLYNTWYGMKSRCYKPNHRAYKDYGARGIKVCDEWLNDPNAFINYIQSLGWKANLTIDRIDYNGDYEPSNIRLADLVMQANNTRRNRMLTYNGETKTMAEWARHLEIPYSRLQARIQRGWEIEKAFTT